MDTPFFDLPSASRVTVLSWPTRVVIGAGAIIGVLAGGPLGDALLHRGRINGRVMVATVTDSR